MPIFLELPTDLQDFLKYIGTSFSSALLRSISFSAFSLDVSAQTVLHKNQQIYTHESS